jgi:hypothetical protein
MALVDLPATWYEAIPSGKGGSVKPMKRKVSFFISKGAPTARTKFAGTIEAGDVFFLSADSSRAGFWVKRTNVNTKIFIDLYDTLSEE